MKKIIFFCSIVSLFISCKKNNDVTPPPASGKVYIAGTSRNSMNNDFPCYWKDGIRTDLPVPPLSLSGEASSIAVSGTDVYAAGNYDIGSKGVPCYWKNGIRTDLSPIDNANTAEVTSMYVSGADLYCAGYSRSSLNIALPCYWKNGIRTNLSTIDITKPGFALSVYTNLLK